MAKKLTKVQEKAKAKNLGLFKMKRLAINNRQAKAKIGNFQAILSNLITNKKSEDKFIPFLTIPINSIVLLKLVNNSYQSIQ